MISLGLTCDQVKINFPPEICRYNFFSRAGDAAQLILTTQQQQSCQKKRFHLILYGNLAF
jgi:hypothetical protein